MVIQTQAVTILCSDSKETELVKRGLLLLAIDGDASEEDRKKARRMHSALEQAIETIRA